ncbi:response regulator receiver protein [Aliiruegeria haliotis]|uniref:Response regulator receiver protein n=1 Tax=Aliiruegeria haliotis TaxID=1280846 RepID=A0A2T0RM12_9RHOB|nr:response regulator [Aliiruegeria haliotis]PRY22153.1 response regulator receiver protein [Aliiruegeria haliotis]
MTPQDTSAAEAPRTMRGLIAPHLPFLRRYARALTGQQVSGDRLAAMTLEAILAEPEALPVGSLSQRAALYYVFHRIWVSLGRPMADDTQESDPLRARAQDKIAKLTENTREALLLHTVEDFSVQDVAAIMELTLDEARHLIETAQNEMLGAVAGRVMIIEDEVLIAMDLQSIVESLGHTVTGIARTKDEAVALGKASEPDLILADIRLADDSSGIDAVNELLEASPQVPVIFITAYPERLLTGERPEPAFLIAKPFNQQQVISAVGQAMFFASTAPLHRQSA